MRFKSIIAAALLAIFTLSTGFVVSCEEGEPPPPPQVVKPTPPPPPPPPPEPTPPPPPPEPKFSYKVYPDENKPEEFVELAELATGCQGIGDIFANKELVINPTLENEQKVPLARIVSLTFVNLGLTTQTIKEVGKVNQPAAYRNNQIVLRNPDETIEGVLVICRQLKGKKADGTDWTTELKLDTAKDFYKIELIEQP